MTESNSTGCGESQLGQPSQPSFVQVCQYRTCARSQAGQVLAAFQAYSSSDCMVSGSGCLGQCGSGPTVRVMPGNIWYRQVRPQDVAEIIEQHIQGQQPVKRLLHPRFHPPS
ncbi:MAG: (2Fe-2S) ferredoxin domain-containing protein [Cyanobacteria bacterium P01_A01_bin.114]